MLNHVKVVDMINKCDIFRLMTYMSKEIDTMPNVCKINFLTWGATSDPQTGTAREFPLAQADPARSRCQARDCKQGCRPL